MQLLSDHEQAVLSRLAVLPGSFRLATALAISERAAEALPALVDHSLAVTEHRTGPTRYRLLEMVRAVAQDALSDEERAEALDRLLVHCIDELAVLAAEALPPPGLDAEIRQDHALHVVAAEHALATAQTELGLRLVHGLFEAWHGVGQRSTLDRWMNRFVAQTDGPSQVRGMVLRRQAIIASEQLGDYDRAMRLLDCAEADALAISDQHLLGKVRGTRAGLDLDAGRLEGLEARLWDAIALLEAAGGDYVANVLTTLGMLHTQRAEFDRAEDALLRAHDANRDWFQSVEIELSRAWCSLLAGRLDVAAVRAATTLDLAEQTGDTDLIAHAIEIAALAAVGGRRCRGLAGAARSHGGVLP